MNELLQVLREEEPKYKENFLPNISIDCVVFGYNKKDLKVLIIQMKESTAWGLPGGFVKKDIPLQEAASQILENRTGAQNIYLHQFKVFGDVKRSYNFYKDMPNDLWFKKRFISIGYYALVDYKCVIPVVDIFSNACKWCDINNLPDMMMDHQHIIDEALIQLRRDLNYKPIGLNLLPEKFTMPELQKLYEIILNKELNRGNFYRKMIRYDILEKLNETRKGGAHKSPDLYSFHKEKYKAALEAGLNEGW